MGDNSFEWALKDQEKRRLTNLDGMLEGILERQTSCVVKKGKGKKGMSETELCSIVTHDA